MKKYTESEIESHLAMQINTIAFIIIHDACGYLPELRVKRRYISSITLPNEIESRMHTFDDVYNLNGWFFQFSSL